MFPKTILCVLCLLCGGEFAAAATSDLADAVMKRDARTVRTLMQRHADVNAPQTDGTTALMWAVSERHADAVTLLLDHGADVHARSNYVAAANGRGFEGRTPLAASATQKVEEFASGWLTPLMFAAREGDVASVRLLVAAGADVTAVAGD